MGRKRNRSGGFDRMLARRNRAHERSCASDNPNSRPVPIIRDENGERVDTRSVNVRVRTKGQRRDSPAHAITNREALREAKLVEYKLVKTRKGPRVQARPIHRLSTNYHIDPLCDRGNSSLSSRDESGLKGTREKRFIKRT